jgi:hypothetical protein
MAQIEPAEGEPYIATFRQMFINPGRLASSGIELTSKSGVACQGACGTKPSKKSLTVKKLLW